MNNRLTYYSVPGLLYLVFFGYRLAFWEDFRYLELLQIVLNAFFDLFVTCLLSLVFYYLANLKSSGIPKALYLLLRSLVFLAGYYVSIKFLQALHLFGYSVTTGMTREFRTMFELVTYQVFDSYIVLAFGMTLLLAFLFHDEFTREKLGKEHAEKERSMAELRFLKAQINPHFVFNTLNNIHFMIDKGNSEARQLIQEFCELLRFQLYETGNEKVKLLQEIEYLNHYINIQKIRKEQGFIVKFDVPGLPEGNIAPMLLVILLENAFKYSGSSEKDYIHINLEVESGNFLTFIVVNTVDRRVLTSDSRRGGLGLHNLQKRLNLIYGPDASLVTEKDEELYRAALKIKLV